MDVLEPHSLPLGHSIPHKDDHAISVSLPSWEKVVQYMKGEKSVVDKLQSDYPRFYEHQYVQELHESVLRRVRAPEYMRCAIFPSEAGMRRCSQYLRRNTNIAFPLQQMCFKATLGDISTTTWARFYAVLYPMEYTKQVREVWAFTGDGISSRHAEFCVQRFALMESTSKFPALTTSAMATVVGQIPIPQWGESDSDVKAKIKTQIAKLVTSHKPGYDAVKPQDVLLYPNGMSAIGAVARSLVPTNISSEAVVFGWPYGSTPKAVRESGYGSFTFYSHGTRDELEQLESSLSAGRSIACLFCEIPSNPLCATPDLHRIRRLADQYHFAVVCDDTIGTFVNVDVLPYADAIITSLTKMFSGACNVMGGSVVLNNRSPLYESLWSRLQESHGDHVFPMDASVLYRNCLDFPTRVQTANSNALAVVKFLQMQDIISHVNYPTTVATKNLYDIYRRPNGGYGYLLSLVFKNPEHAIWLYDSIDLCKGPSCGTNFTLVLPYSQVSHAFELDWAESQGVSKHIVRISVGLEEKSILISKLQQALQAVRAPGCALPTATLSAHFH
ncbi:pyridoxal phosphate-dependent transferase [Clohesyomyces aquaticus]|uniref:Pyridoxal phosphate-dependent transferase n=1 Tax=Clohesyomyces aquaticus TaxID=1231657 RepID=A0A1Y2A391_9PLEO|nr:pyridoxal phosphate-dependent transferase [Clohesyomyces aquaticus]